jgi:hypothetical protein
MRDEKGWMVVDQVLQELRRARQQMVVGAEEAATAVRDHRRAWEQLAEDHGVEPCLPDDSPQAAIEYGRRQEAYYLGQADALTWAIEWLEAALRLTDPVRTQTASAAKAAQADVVVREATQRGSNSPSRPSATSLLT